MARVSYSPLIVDARGKVSDTVFSAWKGRKYIRSRVTPANPKTTAQTAQREKLSAAVQQWQQLHADVVAGWQTYASPYQISGYNAWSRSNISQMAAADASSPNLINDNPTKGTMPSVPSASTGASGEIDLSWTGGNFFPGDYLYIVALDEANSYYDIDPPAGCEKVDATAASHTISGLVSGHNYTILMAAQDDSDSGWWTSSAQETVAAG